MKNSHRRFLPLAPLLRTYLDAGLPSRDALKRLPRLGRRFEAIETAPEEFLNDAWLDRAAADEFTDALLRFYDSCVPLPLHGDTLQRRAGVVRHALAHLLRCPEPIERKLDRCLATYGPYAVPGLGPAFWSALVQALAPERFAAWTRSIETGLLRLGLLQRQPEQRPGQRYALLLNAYTQVREREPALTPFHLDHFFTLVGEMEGRDLWAGPGSDAADCPSVRQSKSAGRRERPAHPERHPLIYSILVRERARLPLRRRLKEQGALLAQARRTLEAGLASGNVGQLSLAIEMVYPEAAGKLPTNTDRAGEALLRWTSELWEAEKPYQLLDSFEQSASLPGAGSWLPAAILHVREPRRYQCWNVKIRQAWASLDEGLEVAPSPGEQYRLFNEAVSSLASLYQIHSVELPGVLGELATTVLALTEGFPKGKRSARRSAESTSSTSFRGFAPETFRFLAELRRNNSRHWMEAHRSRYAFYVREPLVELCRALAERFVRPVLCAEHGWDLDTRAQNGRALTSICKNDYGRSVPYHTSLWITFARRAPAAEGDKPCIAQDTTASAPSADRRDDLQFFVRLDDNGLMYGFRVGRGAPQAAGLLARNVEEHYDLVYRALHESGAAECRFGTDDDWRTGVPLRNAAGLLSWSRQRSVVAFKRVPLNSPLLQCDDLAGEILLTFDALVPLYACAASDHPEPLLAQRTGAAIPPRFGEAEFLRATYLPPEWLHRARELLALKRQLILQGVPGTGKTFVARCLARLVARNHDDAIRLVQFHPAYQYEEFIEGIKVKSVEIDGRHDVSYPVEQGLLCTFAAEAARCPSRPYVLIIDEINRGNLPRIFGELLYLLEYRDQAVDLPYSKQPFRLPANLYLIGTMNAADHSVVMLDQALRRRFSLLEMKPDPEVLASWLRAHPPRGGPSFAEAMVTLFQRLNARLATDVGPHAQVGHSYFMVPELDEERLRVIWEHQVRPLLNEALDAHRGGIPASYDLTALFRFENPSAVAEEHRRLPQASLESVV